MLRRPDHFENATRGSASDEGGGRRKEGHQFTKNPAVITLCSDAIVVKTGSDALTTCKSGTLASNAALCSTNTAHPYRCGYTASIDKSHTAEEKSS
jgi:hypothetical protein